MSDTPENPGAQTPRDDSPSENSAKGRPAETGDAETKNEAIDRLVSDATSKRKRGGKIAAAAIAAVALVLAFLGVKALLRDDDSSSGASRGSSGTGSVPSGSVGARTPDEITKSGTIRIGVFSDKPPFGSVDQNGEYQGYDVVYARRIAKDLKVKVEFVPVEAASRVEFLTSGKVDVILANFTVTDERAEKVDFAKPYMKVSLGAVSPKDRKVTEESQLAGKRVIVVKGTTADAYIAANHPDWNVTKYEQYSEATNALIDGRGDAWVTDNTEALAFSLKNKDRFVTGITQLGPVDSIAAAVQKGNVELLSWLNEELVQLGEERFFHEDYERTLKPVYGEAAKPEELVVEGGALQ